MNPYTAVRAQAPRDRWMDACGASVFVSVLLIVGYVAFPLTLGLEMPYAGGGAVALGIGATLGLWFRSRPTRVVTAIALLGLMALRAISSLQPDLFIAKHGDLSLLDGGALILLIVAAVSVLGVAIAQPTSGPDTPPQPSAFAGR